MAIIISPQSLEKLRKKKQKTVKRISNPKDPVSAERLLKKEIEKLWATYILPVSGEIQRLVKEKASPEVLSDYLSSSLIKIQSAYNIAAGEIADMWKISVDKFTRVNFQDSLSKSLGVDILGVLETPEIKEALDISVFDSTQLIKTIPNIFIGEVAKAVTDNYYGRELPEGRSLMQQIQHIGNVSKKRASVIARDQTFKLTGTLNEKRQTSIGIDEYIWRTSKDNRVVGKPGGLYPKGNDKHMDHYKREGKRFRWDSPPPDGHPGKPILCRCHAEAVVVIKKIIEYAEVA